jgi:hypothetical protein
MKLKEGARPIISVEAQRELQTLAASVEDPAHTLIVARHGLEWWTAWTLHTHIAQAQALQPEDWTNYKYVWFIEQKQGMQMPFGPGGGGPPVMGRGPRDGPMGMAMPLPGMMSRGPSGRGGMPGGMRDAQIPDEASVLHEGKYFKLAWVHDPPPFVLQKNANPLDPFAGWP